MKEAAGFPNPGASYISLQATPLHHTLEVIVYCMLGSRGDCWDCCKTSDICDMMITHVSFAKC